MRRLCGALPSARASRAARRCSRGCARTAEEIALTASRIADQAITDALASVHPGDSEMDIAAALTRNIYALGAEQFKLMIVATGEAQPVAQRRADRAPPRAARRLPGGVGDRRLPGRGLPHRGGGGAPRPEPCSTSCSASTCCST
jgi:hypothetical protein